MADVPKRSMVYTSLKSICLGRSLSILAVLLVVAPLVACASRPETGFLASVPESVPGATDHTVLIATTRQRDARPGTFFNGERAPSQRAGARQIAAR